MRLPLRLLEQVTGRSLSAHAVAHHLEQVGFPVAEIIELLPYDPAVCTARVSGVLKELDDGFIVTTETGSARHVAYSHRPVLAESIVAIALADSDSAKQILSNYADAEALILVEKDLGLESEQSIIFPSETPLGVGLADVLESTVLDVEITPNRGDLYSLYGLARELSVMWGERFEPPSIQAMGTGEAGHGFRLEIEAKEDVRQYYGYVIDNVKVQESPFWLRWLLHAFGVRAVNNVVDVSNYVMLLTGQPLHAFDASKISSSLVRVRRARPNEAFTAIDHKSYKLSEECLLIADENRPLALAGVMGGLDSEVDTTARRLFLESAEFTPQAVRRSIGRIGLQSESSKRFAAGVDSAMIRAAAQVFTEVLSDLIPDLAFKGELCYGSPLDKGTVKLDYSKLDAYALMQMDRELAKQNLELIGFEVEETPDSISVHIPSHRCDVTEDVDIIEEVLRLSGYENLPSRFVIRSERPGKRHPLAKRLDLVADFFTGLGFSEVYGLSLVSSDDLSSYWKQGNVKLVNPMTERMSYLRPSLLPGLLSAAAENLRFGKNDLMLYEIGNTFVQGKKETNERLHIGVLMSGNAAPLFWGQAARAVDFFDLKGVIEMFFAKFGLSQAEFQPASLSALTPGEALWVNTGRDTPVALGKVTAELLERFEIGQAVYFSEIDFTTLDEVITDEVVFQPLPRYQEVERDIALVIDANQRSDSVCEFVKSEAGSTCKRIEVFDSYTGSSLPAGKRNLALRLTFLSENGNMSKKELDELMVKVASSAAAKFGALIRGREADGS